MGRFPQAAFHEFVKWPPGEPGYDCVKMSFCNATAGRFPAGHS
jgi:hypothetical protein